MKKTLLFFLSFCYAASSFAQWERKTGIEPGEINRFVEVDTILFASTEGGVYQSTDNGISWNEANNGLTHYNINCMHFDGINLWVGTEFGSVFMSPDTGQTWIQKNLFGPKTSDITSDSTGVYVSRDGGYIIYTPDNGQTWIDIDGNNGLPTSNCLKMVSDGSTVWLLCTFGVYATTDQGQTWTTSSVGLSGSNGINNLYLFNDTLYCTRFNEVFFSADGGVNWAVLGGTGIDPNAYGFSFLKANNGSYFFATNYGIYKSTDSGNSWTSISYESGNHLTDVDGRIFYGGNLNGALTIGYSDDEGVTWNAGGNGIHSMSIGCIAVTGNKIISQRHSGAEVSFNQCDSFNDFPALSTKPTGFFKNTTGLFALSSGLVLSTDGGNTFNSIVGDFQGSYITSVFADGNTWLIGTPSDGIWRSVNNGANWVQTNGPWQLFDNFTAICKNGNTLFAGGQYGVFISNDDGLTWTTTSITNSAANLTVSGNAVIASGNNMIRRSTDFGASWTNIPVGTSTNAVYALHTIGNTVLAGTRFGGVRISYDNGLTWSGANLGLPDTLLIIQTFANDQDYIYFGSRGAGIWRRGLAELNITVPNQLPEKQASIELSMMPNPAEETIQFTTAGQNGILKIYDAEGRLVHSSNPGNTLRLNIEHLKSGIYLAQFSTMAGKMVSKRFVKK